MRTAAKLMVAISAVAVIAVGCSNNKSGGSSGDNHLIIGTTSNIDTMNPFVTFQQNSYAAFEYIYPQLVQFDPGG